MNNRDFLNGLAISVACEILPVKKVYKEPIAYSYNGVVLPKLPEWDRSVYPFAYIAKLSGIYRVVATEYRACKTSAFDIFGWINGEERAAYCNAILFDFEEGDLSWGEGRELEINDHDNDYMIWTEYDVYNYSTNGQGALFMAGTEPTPIYEQTKVILWMQ